MAFVDVPDDIGIFRVPTPSGSSRRLAVSVFAGEIAAVRTYVAADPEEAGHATALNEEDSAARGIVEASALTDPSLSRMAIKLRSAHDEAEFDFNNVTLPFRRGHLAAVAAVMPENAEHGPVVAVANIDLDRKEEFVGREQALLRQLSGYRRDYRQLWPGLWLLLGAALKAVLVYIGLSVALVFGARHPSLPPETAQLLVSFIDADAPFFAAAAIYMLLSIAAVGIWQARAYTQRQLLRRVWAAVGDAFDLVRKQSPQYRIARPRAAARNAMSAERNRRSERTDQAAISA